MAKTKFLFVRAVDEPRKLPPVFTFYVNEEADVDDGEEMFFSQAPVSQEDMKYVYETHQDKLKVVR